MAATGKDVGESLRAARERRGLSLQQIAKATRISVQALDAIERNDIARLPGGIFSRGFVRGYAHEVGLDAEEVVREFVEQFPVDAVTYGSPLVDTSHTGVDRTLDPDLRPWPNMAVVGTAVVVGVVGLTLAVLWARGALTASASGGDPSPASPPSPIAAPAAAPREAPAAVRLDALPPAPAMTTATDGLQVSIASDHPCWARVVGDGQVRFEGLLRPGIAEARESRRTLVVTVGDAGRCRVTLNGRPTRPLGAPGQVVTLRITPDTVGRYLAR